LTIKHKEPCICAWIKAQIEQVPPEHRTALEDTILAKFEENDLTVADLFELQANVDGRLCNDIWQGADILICVLPFDHRQAHKSIDGQVWYTRPELR